MFFVFQNKLDVNAETHSHLYTNGICYQDDLNVKPILQTVENSNEAGNFEIIITNASNDNYNITYKNGKLNVTAHTECRGGVNSCTKLAICTICDKEYGKLLDHQFDNYIYNNDATCVSKGTKSSKCSYYEKIDTIDNKEGDLGDHIFNNYQYNNDATCIKDGIISSKCIHCDEIDKLVLENGKTEHLNQNDDKHCDFCNKQIVPNSKLWIRF